MTAEPRRRPSRHQQRRIRRRQDATGEPYLVAAAAVEEEWARGQRYLADPSVPAEVAAAVRRAGLIPLEALDLSIHWEWWCRCRWCGQVVEVRPKGHGYQSPGRCPYFLHEYKHKGGRCTRPAPDLVVFEGSLSTERLEQMWPLFPQRAHRVDPRSEPPTSDSRPSR
ncbi:hypothetical protein ACH35V_13230 [Actinomadura sp. 1N219]|uniref:hypothetical protein n=1 Tax=Actinomadura sp. 1N219 TaxID=3375152 RepID=UPI0037A2D8B7